MKIDIYIILKDNPKAENDLCTSQWQEPKISQYGGKNIRYKTRIKRELINRFRAVHSEVIPWNTIRYIF